MPNRRVRGFLALAVIAGSALPGLTATGAAAEVLPTVPTGGCWTYVPAAMAPIEDLTAHVDVSTALEPWTPAPALPELRFASGGDTAVGGSRTFAVSISGGPGVTAQAVETTGTVAYLVDLVDASGVRTRLAPVLAPFSLAPGAVAIPATSATGAAPLTLPGTSMLVLRSVIYDLPTVGQRVVCNGQVEGVPGGTNPATIPLDQPVVTQFGVSPGTGMEITNVSKQRVDTAARAGDAIDLSLAGFPSEVSVDLAVCTRVVDESEAPTCGTAVPVLTALDGTAVASIPVAEEVTAGDGFVRASVTGGPLVVESSMQVLGEPSVAPHPDASPKKWRLVGEQWDPAKRVHLSLMDAEGRRIGPRVVAKAGARGRIRARLDIPSRRTAVKIRAVQRKSGRLVTFLDLDKAGLTRTPGGSKGGGSKGGGGNGGASQQGGSTGGSAQTPSVVPESTTATAARGPVQIPLPRDIKVDVVEEEPGKQGGSEEKPVARSGEVAVTEAVLVGSAELSDLFGGAPSRVLRMVVENVSKVDARAPGLTIAVGKAEDAEPVYVSDGFGTLEPGESRVVEVPISLPIGAFGTYTVSGQFGEGETGGFSLTWETYPWGLFALNLLGLLLIAWAVHRRRNAFRPELAVALAGPPRSDGEPVAGDGEAIIDLATLTRWWDLQAAPGPDREPAALDDAVVDLAAMDRWMTLRADRDLSLK
ncbi:hypothetical protein [Nocardioides sp. 616]|uniref:hypothetical protein n=1 Tax=Nocardioides sp. 616 TaxID=2268090 RepID=UPI0013B459A4|nr:hypothetical protein [Nocardioides sp. 616]